MEPLLVDQLLDRVGMRRLPITDPEEARQLAESARARFVMTGRVEELNQERVAFQITMYDVQGEDAILENVFSSQDRTMAAEASRVDLSPHEASSAATGFGTSN